MRIFWNRSSRVTVLYLALVTIVLAGPATVFTAEPLTQSGLNKACFQEFAPEALVSALLLDARSLLYGGNFLAALRQYQRAIESDSTSVEAFEGLSLAYRYLGDETKSYRACRRALRLDSLAVAANWNMGELLWPWRRAELGEVDSDEERLAASFAYLERAASDKRPMGAHANMSMCIAAVATGQKDRLINNLRALRERNYYPPLILACQRQLLNSLEMNAVLVVGGDVDFLATICLQLVDSVRPDVSIVPASMVGYADFVLNLREWFHFPLTLTRFELEHPTLGVPGEPDQPSNPSEKVLENIVAASIADGRVVCLQDGASNYVQDRYFARLELHGSYFRVTSDSTALGRVNSEQMEEYLSGLSFLDTASIWSEWCGNISPITSRLDYFFSSYAHYLGVLGIEKLSRGEDSGATVYLQHAIQLYDRVSLEGPIQSLLRQWRYYRPNDAGAERVNKERNEGSI